MTGGVAVFLWACLCATDAPSIQVQPAAMMTDYLNRLAGEAETRRTTAREALATPEDVAAYQEHTRAFFLEQLGGWPERTPLNTRVVGAEQRDGYRYEKVIFESRPNFFVTAVLFLPLSEPPYPGVLVPCGHSENGKGSELYQRACISLAMNGMAALIYDPIDQGERFQIVDAEGKPRLGGTMGHTMTGQGCILLGTNTAAFRIWDGMRAMDYLTEREDIDQTRIGCTGNSGGGTLTSYLMALDERIVCAAPSCYLTSFTRLLATDGPQDSEQDIYGQIAFGMGHADYIMMRAPKPTLVCCATRDFFDISGTWDSFREAKRLYTKLGAFDCVDIVEAPEQHGFSILLRQAAVHWMKRWLLDVNEPVIEAEVTVLTDDEIRCTPEGQVMRLPGAKSTYDINAEQEAGLAPIRAAYWRDAPRQEVMDKVRSLANVPALDSIPNPEVATIGAEQGDGYLVEKLILRPEPGIMLPALALVPENPVAAVLYVSGEGKETIAAPDGPAASLARQGVLVLAPDLRGIGETAPPDLNAGWRDRFGNAWKDYYRAYLLGKSYVGMRAQDILVCGRFLASFHAEGGPREVRLVATGEAAIPALHAAALEPALFASLRLERTIERWADVIHAPEARGQLINTVHGALRWYDLPDLVASLPEGFVTIAEPVKP